MMKQRALILATGLLGAALFSPTAFLSARASAKDHHPPAVAPAPQRTALMVFVSYRSRFLPPINPSLVRIAAYRAVTEKLEARGDEVIPYPLMEPLLQAWRVRTGGSFGYEFLFETSARLGAERLMVLDLSVYTDRVILHGRALDARTGRIFWIDQVEELFIAPALEAGEGTAVEWSELLDRVAASVVERFRVTPVSESARELIFLPVQPVGVEPVQTDLATYSILGALVRDGRWILTDPALVVRDLQDRGYPPGVVGEKARAALVERFGEAPILMSTLLSYKTPVGGNLPAFLQEDVFLTPARSAEEPLFLELTVVDSRTGTVLYGASEFIDRENPLGLFGVVHTHSLPRRFDRAAERMAKALPARLMES
ncbi:MAG: hypothetical protein ABIK65_09020 [Candidatus Eisenbacteria bacterium]